MFVVNKNTGNLDRENEEHLNILELEIQYLEIKTITKWVEQ